MSFRSSPEIVKPHESEKPACGASVWKRDPAGIRTRDPQLRSRLEIMAKALIYKLLITLFCLEHRLERRTQIVHRMCTESIDSIC